MSAADAAAISAIESTLRDAAAAVARNDLDGLIAMFHDAPATLICDFMPPRQTDIAGLRRSFREMNSAASGPVTCEVLQIRTGCWPPTQHGRLL
jgi:hypothetical protein